MIPYSQLRGKLDSAPLTEWEVILAEFLGRHDSKEDELDGQVIGFSVGEVLLHDNSIEATVSYVVMEGAKPDDNGAYQDEDGESYDHDEREYVFHLVITSVETRWERL